MSDRKIDAVIVAFVIIAFSISVFIPVSTYNEIQENRPAQFIISSWSYPDSYGQGIEWMYLYENSSGSFQHERTLWYYNSSVVNWTASLGIEFKVACWFNSSLVGVSTQNEGKAYQRHNVTVIDTFGTELYNKANFTYEDSDNSLNPPLWRYVYYVILDWMPSAAQTYYITITYEIYYRSGEV